MANRSYGVRALLGLLLLAAPLAGCSRLVPFTADTRDQHQLSDAEVGQLQFYLSHEVTLRRQSRRLDRTIRNGHLKIAAGKTVQEVVVPAGTPGVAIAVAAHRIEVSFSEGSSLVFSLRGEATSGGQAGALVVNRFAEAPEPFPELVVEPEPPGSQSFLGGGNYWFLPLYDHQVTFLGRTWDAVDGSQRAHLLIDAETLQEVVEERTTLDGRRLGKRFKRGPAPARANF